MNTEFEVGDHALHPLSGIVEAMVAAGVERHCHAEACFEPWQRDDDRERPLPRD